jgi:PPOX class probable F420-dependent enzyme
MPADRDLRELIASRRQGVPATVKRGGLPQLTNVLYLPGPGGRTARISTTAGRLKARVLARDPRAVLHVTGDSFRAYAAAEGHAALTPPAAQPGDQACRELLEVHSAFYGPQDQDTFFTEMITRQRLVIRLRLDRVHGVITTAGPRPLPTPTSTPRLPRPWNSAY